MATVLGTVLKEQIQTSRFHNDFAASVSEGFSNSHEKKLPPQFLYDDLGSALFEAITVLPEYGLTRADERVLQTHSDDIAEVCGPLDLVAELGSGSGKKTAHILRAALRFNPLVSYFPIDVSAAALTSCEREMATLCEVRSVCSDWTEGLVQVAQRRSGRLPLLLLFLGSSIGNLDRSLLPAFLQSLRAQMRVGDYFLLGADLEKDISTMLAAYDDPTGVTAAFNLNLLGRMNRELGADFNLRAFKHEARWNCHHRRIEMHLVSLRDQHVHVAACNETYGFTAGETIWTESSHKFSVDELQILGRQNGFSHRALWIDQDWPLAEVLWQAA